MVCGEEDPVNGCVVEATHVTFRPTHQCASRSSALFGLTPTASTIRRSGPVDVSVFATALGG
jgi:hypothetical protein